MSSLLRKKNNNKDTHLKGAFEKEQELVIEKQKKTAMIRVDEDLKDELSFIVKIEKHGSANNLLKKMVEVYKLQMNEEDLKKLNILK